MKINPLNPAIQYLDHAADRVKESRDGHNQSNQQAPDKQKKDEKESEAKQAAETFEDVQAAVNAFHADIQSQANSLSAAIEGTGPGLKVVLKDGSSAVIRQFTGEEFLKLREVVAKGKSRGKILDQKL
jgi:uncharacterized protein YlxW (UPF0749 family)